MGLALKVMPGEHQHGKDNWKHKYIIYGRYCRSDVCEEDMYATQYQRLLKCPGDYIVIYRETPKISPAKMPRYSINLEYLYFNFFNIKHRTSLH